MDPDQLRSLVQDCIAKHLYSTAVFYADKLVTLTQYAPGDVYLLAQVRMVLIYMQLAAMKYQQRSRSQLNIGQAVAAASCASSNPSAAPQQRPVQQQLSCACSLLASPARR
jgi:hypothetical protein